MKIASVESYPASPVREETSQRDIFLSDETLQELRDQASSCLLCMLEEMDDEDWE